MATKTSAPTSVPSHSDNSRSYSPGSRSEQVPEVSVKGQPSGGGLTAINGVDPESGTTKQ